MGGAERSRTGSPESFWPLVEADLGVAAFAWDFATGTSSRTNRFCELHGLDPAADLTRESALATVHPQDRHLWMLDNARLERDGGSYAREFRILRPGGEARRVLGVGRVVTDDEGRPLRLLGTLTDLSGLGRTVLTEGALRRVLEAAPVGIAQVRPDGGFLYINRRFCDILGRSCGALMAQGFQEVVPDEAAAENAAGFARLTAGEVERYALEMRLLRPDGGVTWARLSVSAVREDDASLRHAVAAVEDVTERREARQALALNEQRFRVALENSAITVFNQDTDLRYTWIHNPRPDIQGVILGRNDDELIAEETLEPVKAFKREVLKGGGRRRATLRIRPKDSAAEAVYDLFAEPTRDETGAIDGIACAAADVTELHAQAEAARLAEARFRASVEGMLDAFGVYAAIRGSDGRIEDFRVEYVNQAACRENMMTREEQVGRRLLEILPGHRTAGLFDAYRRVVETGEPLRREEDYVDVFGGEPRRRTLDISVSRLGDGFVASWRDVTERRTTARALEEALGRSELLLKELEHRVANNLQLLTSVLSLQARQADPTVRTALDKVRRQIALISSLHRMLRADQRDVRRVPFDEYLAAVAEALTEGHDLARRRIEVVIEAEPLTVSADDAVTFGLIVNELATNALKHAFVGRDRGRIAVRLAREGGDVTLTVADDGVGFDAASVRSGDGSKLVEQLTRSLRGALEIDSAGAGAAWRMRFPADRFDGAGRAHPLTPR